MEPGKGRVLSVLEQGLASLLADGMSRPETKQNHYRESRKRGLATQVRAPRCRLRWQIKAQEDLGNSRQGDKV